MNAFTAILLNPLTNFADGDILNILFVILCS